jgi:hypothetical protein
MLAAAAALCALAGCGSAHNVGSDRTLQVGLTEYRVVPQSAHAPAGMLTIVAHNYGRLTHDLAVLRNGQPEGSTAPIPPGGSADLTVYLPKGRYTLASTILSDQALGAYGTLMVG